MTRIDPRLFPCILIVLDFCAAAVYVGHGDWRRCGYWLCAAGITFFATF